MVDWCVTLRSDLSEVSWFKHSSALKIKSKKDTLNMKKRQYPPIGKLPRKMHGVMFQEKEHHQKDDCITRSFGGNCMRKSTMVACNGNSSIRCCSSPVCMKFAASLAQNY